VTVKIHGRSSMVILSISRKSINEETEFNSSIGQQPLEF
jgi:hypothetical protein